MTISWLRPEGLLALLLVALAVSCREAPQPPALNHYGLKADFVDNISQFTDWPANAFADPRAPLVIGILGADPFGANLENVIRGQKVNGRRLRVQHFHRADEVRDCQLLFISASETKRLPGILNTLNGRSILTVSDLPDFARRGGMIGLVNERDQIELQINFDVLRAVGLNVSAKLLRTAEIVSTTIE